MADLTLQQLADKLPAGSLDNSTPGEVTISLATLLGEAVDLADQKVAEFFTKLLAGASSAQVDYNAANETNLTGYPNPTFGTPTAAADGNIYSRRTHTVTVQVPVNVDETVGA